MPQCQIAGDATDLKKREHSVYVVGNFAARVMYVSCMKRIDATYEVCVAYSEIISTMKSNGTSTMVNPFSTWRLHVV